MRTHDCGGTEQDRWRLFSAADLMSVCGSEINESSALHLVILSAAKDLTGGALITQSVLGDHPQPGVNHVDFHGRLAIGFVAAAVAK
jgi:hypothetical protein